MAISAEQLWEQISARLKEKLNRPTFETWIQNAKIESFNAESLTLMAPNAFVMNHLQKHYLDTIGDVVTEILGKSLDIRLISAQNDSLSFDVGYADLLLDENKFSNSPKSPLKPIQLNPKYTFYRFVVGPTNR
ncbi:MAG: DnaA N-terminal domain-containing protein, partial [Cyanobacteria bacterium P01_G01_bin.19]